MDVHVVANSEKQIHLCVFCGSRQGSVKKINKAVIELGQELVRRNIHLVYGGASVGTMGQLADVVLGLGGKVTGVIPQALVDREVAHTGLTKLHKVRTMHERKQLMFDLSDAFLTFPGGYGTLDESFEMITWVQIGIHRKPMVWLNIDHYFDRLLDFIDHAIKCDFISKQNKSLFRVATSVEEALEGLDK